MNRKPTRMLTQEQAINVYFCTVEEGVTLDDVMAPGFWAHVCKQLLPHHEIKVFPADGAWRAHLLVRSVGATEALVHLLQFDDFAVAASEVVDASQFTTKYRGPSHMHCVIRKDNGAVEKANFATNDAALGWIAEHAKAMDR